MSSRVIFLTVIMIAFILPRLYISNKDLVDARLQQSQAIVNTQLHCIQQFVKTSLDKVKLATKEYRQKTAESTKKAN